MSTLVENATAIANGYNNYRTAITRPANAEIVVPQGAAKIASYAFYYFSNLKSVTIPSSVITIEINAFNNCSGLTTVSFAEGLTTIEAGTFSACLALGTLILPDSLTTIGGSAFSYSGLATLTIPAGLTSIGNNAFNGCSKLENVTIKNGFNCDGLNLSSSTKFTADTIVGWLNALADRTGDTAYTLTIGATNINKLSTAQKAIATNKNWLLA